MYPVKYFTCLFSGLILFCVSSTAQLCNGSLGDPIVNIDFGNGNNPGLPLAAATTAYNFVYTDCPDDGYYTVRNRTDNCFGSSWHSLSADHTGNGQGYFMLVNASLQPSAFYVDTVRGLCANTNFEFAAWLVNILRASACGGSGIRPNLTFNIEKTDGTLLQTYNTGYLESTDNPLWKQYGFYFTTPAGVSDIVLRIFNNSQGGCGNDIALDDITFRPCGPKIEVSIDGYDKDSIYYCEAAAAIFTLRGGATGGFVNPVYQWQQSSDGVTWTDISGENRNAHVVAFVSGTLPGKYLYRLSVTERENAGSIACRVLSRPIQIIKGTRPVTSMSISSPACEGGSVTFTASGGSAYLWTRENGGLGVSDNPLTIPDMPIYFSGKIYVKITGEGGCTVTDSAYLNVLPKPPAAVGFKEAALCAGESKQLTASGGVAYEWQPAATLSATNIANPVATPLVSTDYIVKVTGANTCSARDTVSLKVIQHVEANAGPDKAMIQGETVQLEAVSWENSVYSWSPSLYLNDDAILNPVAAPPSDINYVLTVTSLYGCGTDTDTMQVKVFKDIFVPSAFSPNGDGLNDKWNIPALAAFGDFTVTVFNRWGKQVYMCSNQQVGWDGYYNGQPLDPGVYVYIIRFKDNKRPLIKGQVLLLR